MRGVLKSLAEQTLLPHLVIVVDNGGTFTEADRIQWMLADRSLLISRPDNPGYAAAVNLAREHVGDHALLVLTHDADFESTLAELLLVALQKDKVGSVGPLLRFSNNHGRIFSAGGKLSKAGRASHLSSPLSNKPYRVDWVDGAIVMYAPQALDHIGWLDEQYFLYFEDVDTGWRLEQAGWHNLLVPRAVAFQQPGAHPPYLGMRNMALFARKAGISRAKHLMAVIPRIARETASRMRRGLKPKLADALRGLHAGYAGESGPVAQNSRGRKASSSTG